MSAQTRARLFSVGLAALLAVSLLFGAAGGAAAADVEVHNSTVSVDSDTQSVYAEVNNTAANQANLTIEWVGLDADGNTTGTLDTQNVTVTAGSETLYEATDLDAENNSDVRVKVMLDDTTASEENISVTSGAIQKVAGGGGGGLFDGNSGKAGIGIIAVLALLALAGGKD